MSSYADHTYYPFPPVLTAEDREYSKMVSATTNADLARRVRPTAENPYPEERIAPLPPSRKRERVSGATDPTDERSDVFEQQQARPREFADPYDDYDEIDEDDSIYEFVRNWWPKNKIRVKSPEI